MKKSNVPDTQGKPTSAFVLAVKEILEIACGRRGNAIALPEIRTLTISNPPTQAEMQAMNEYVNAHALAFKALVKRFDE